MTATANKKMTINEQVMDYYLLGSFFLQKARNIRFCEKESAILDHIDNMRLECLFLGLSGEYLLKSYS